VWLKSDFYLPPAFDITAVFFFALTGVLAQCGAATTSLACSPWHCRRLGGALIRDGLFLQDGPPALTKDGRYIVAVLAGCAAGWCIGHPLERFRKVIAGAGRRGPRHL